MNNRPEPPRARLGHVQRRAARTLAMSGRGNAAPLSGERTRPHPDPAIATADEAAVGRGRRDITAAAVGVTLADVRRAYPTWRAWPTENGYMAQAVLVPSLTVRAATAPGLLHEIEAGIDARREGGTR